MVSGIFLALLSAGTCVSAYRLGLGNVSNPGAGSIPFGIAVILGLMSVGLLVKSLLLSRKEIAPVDRTRRLSWLRPLFVLAILIAYGTTLTYLGFAVCTFLIMMALMWGVGRQKLLLSLAVSVTTTAAAYLLFVTLLGLMLPAGTVWSFMGE